jgi:chaperone BCS1
VTAASSMRKWSVRPNHLQSQSQTNSSIAEYVPTYDAPQIFRWNGYWVEIKRNKSTPSFNPEFGGQASTTMYMTWASTPPMFSFRISDSQFTMTRIYTRNMSAITSLVEEARRRYLETSRPMVVVHTADQVSLSLSCPLKSKCQSKELTIFFSSLTLVHHSAGVVPRIKFVDLSAQSFCQKVS